MTIDAALAVAGDLALHEVEMGADIDEALAARRHDAERQELRTEIMAVEHDALVVRALIHLLPPGTERELVARCRQLDDEIVLLGHCPAEPSVERSLAAARRLRESLGVALDSSVRIVDVRLAARVRATSAADWSRSDLPEEVLRRADQQMLTLRVALGDAVENLVDSGIVTVRRRRRQTPYGIVELALADHDPDSVARAEAFAADAALVVDIAAQLTERMRLTALHRRSTRGSGFGDRSWAVRAALRRRRACDALDRSRALHAALSELRATEVS